MGISVILAFALRVNLLDGQSLRGDEAASATYASFPAAKIVAISHTIDPHPPTFYLLLHLWEQVAGVSVFAVRLWVVIPAVLSVAAIFSLVKQVSGWRMGAVAAFLLAINSYHIWHAQDLRSYTWVLLLGLLASLALWQALRHPRVKNWGWYATALLGLIYLHYYAVFIVGFHLLFAAYFLCSPPAETRIEPQRHRDTEKNKVRVLAHYAPQNALSRSGFFLKNLKNFVPLRLCGEKFRRNTARRAIIWGMSGSLAVAAIVFLPWLIFSWQFVSGFSGDFSPASPWMVLVRGLRAFSGGIVAAPPHPSPWTVAAILLAGVGAVGYWRKQRSAVIFFLLYLGITFVGIAVLSGRGLAFTERYLFAALPGFVALEAMGTLWFWRNCRTGERAVGLALVIIAVTVNVSAWQAYRFNPALAKAPQWRQVFDFVTARQNSTTDVLLYNYPEAAVTYYADTRLSGEKPAAVLVPFAADESPDAVAAELSPLLAGYRRAWFVPVSAHGWDDTGAVQTWLERHAVRLDGVSAHWATAALYLTPAAVLVEMTPQPIRFENGVRLLGFRVVNNGAISAENPLKITLVWQADHPVTKPLTVFVQLIDSTGFRRGGQDNPPVGGTYPVTEWQPGETVMDSYAIALDAGAPAGEYRVWVGWYNPQTSARVPLVGGADHVVLSLSARVE